MTSSGFQRIKRAGIIFLCASIFLLPQVVKSQVGPGPIDPPAAGGGITNPLKVASFTQLLINVTQFLLRLVGILALLALVIGGIRLILALGREEEIKKAKTVIWWAVAGLIVVLLAFFIINTVGKLLGLNGP